MCVTPAAYAHSSRGSYQTCMLFVAAASSLGCETLSYLQGPETAALACQPCNKELECTLSQSSHNLLRGFKLLRGLDAVWSLVSKLGLDTSMQ